MEGDFIKLNEWLRPLSWLYGLAVRFRNALFNVGILKSQAYDMPVIAVGNLTVGGTGKTPHVEYLIRLLQHSCRVAVLSRGYKRKTKGFVLAGANDNARTIGDEPFQMKRKFPKAIVAVDKNRRRGIEMLSDNNVAKNVDVVLLDDAYQHRYVKPGINILLVDYHRLIIHDLLLPAGRLREPLSGKDRADMVIVTKCPKALKPMDYRVITKQMNLFPYQQLYFTTIDYEPLRQLFGKGRKELSDIAPNEHVLLLTGIASPRQMALDIEPYTKNIHTMAFADHHAFTKRDVERINKTFDDMPTPRLIVTTEKDAARLGDADGLSDEARRNIFTLPVRIRFMLDQEESFNEKIIGYVRKNSRNSILAKAKDDNKAKNSNNTGNRTRTISFRNN